MVRDVSELVALHLRFHGYGEGEWTDSAVRRYVRDAGPLLTRLHVLTRADCTTRNQAKAQRLARAYDDLEQRIAELSEQEELARIRPDLDGNEIMAILGLAPGPLVGQGLRLPARAAHGARPARPRAGRSGAAALGRGGGHPGTGAGPPAPTASRRIGRTRTDPALDQPVRRGEDANPGRHQADDHR